MEVDQMGKIVVAVSGFFDPIHAGHIDYLREAKKLGDELIVILSTDKQCNLKKGFVFMPYEEREKILLAIRYVDKVVPNIDLDITSAKSLAQYSPTIFCKGGDRTPENMPIEELKACKKSGIIIVYKIGGGKTQSSSWLINRLRKERNGQK